MKHILRGALFLMTVSLLCSVVIVPQVSAAYGGSTTLGLYDPGHAVFYLRNSNTSGPADLTVQYGNANWIPLAGDWDNNGTQTLGAYDPATSRFYLRNTNNGGPADIAFQYGNIGWIPLSGDWNGNGYWSIGLYDPATSTFYLRDTNSEGAADYVAQYGDANWKPVVGDWNNDRVTTLGIVFPNQTNCMECPPNLFYLRNSNTTGSGELAFFAGGGVGKTSLAGDWNSNGYWSSGMYNSNNATFYLSDVNGGFQDEPTATYIAQYGNSGLGWLPIVGDWDGR